MKPTRRVVLSLIPLMGSAVIGRTPPCAWFNYRITVDGQCRPQCWPPDLIMRTAGGRILLDGKEIRQVFYANTALGEVGTYDALGDGEVHVDRNGDPLSKILRGSKVEIFGPDGSPA